MLFRSEKRKNEIKITFDEFLQPAVRAKRAGEPYAPLVFDIPEYEIDLISTYHRLPRVYWRPQSLNEDTSDSEYEVDDAHSGIDEETAKDDQIMMIWGLPFFA